MSLPPEFLDELRARIPLSDVVGRRIRLTKAGREHKGLCPFHSEKTPSFTVADDKGFFHCFGCGAHGDVIGFVMRQDGLSFPEAVERLASDCGLDVPKPTPEAAAQARRMDGLRDVLTLAVDWFEKSLAQPRGAPAREYLANRGLEAATIEVFRLGFAPAGRNALHVFLAGEGVDDALAVEAGLVRRPDDGRPPFDFFRDRIIFPIADPRGRIIAFGGRALGDQKAKYLNSPDSTLFQKGHTLFNLDKARQAARQAGTILVAEGYMDVIALHQAGLTHAVAPLGTAITEAQIGLLWRVVPEPVLCLDGDTAGLRAAGRAADRALPLLSPGHSLKLAYLPAGEDPDSLIQAGRLDALRGSLDRAQGLADFLWRREVEEARADTPERRAGLRKRLDMLVGQIRDRDVRDLYFADMRDRFDQAFSRAARRATVGVSRRPGGTAWQRDKTRFGALPRPTSIVDSREPVLVATVVNHPEILIRHEDEFEQVPLRNRSLDHLRRRILEIYGEAPHIDETAMRQKLRESGLGESLAALFRAHFGSRFSLEFVQAAVDLEEARNGWLEVLDRHYRALEEDERGSLLRRLSRPRLGGK